MVERTSKEMLKDLLKMKVSLFNYEPALKAASELFSMVVDIQEDHEKRLDAIEEALNQVKTAVSEVPSPGPSAVPGE